jgi:hypothetical protein
MIAIRPGRVSVSSSRGRLAFLIFAFVMLPYGRAWAQNVSELYSMSELQTAGDRYLPHLRGMWEEDFLSKLTPEERLHTVTLKIPLIGDNGYPLDFYSDPAQREVFLPVASVKFVDDLSVAFAYYEENGCNVGPVSDYAGILRFRSEYAKGSPLDVLGVPRTAINNQNVDDLAQKILKSTVFFLAAHEYAHVMYHHKPYGAITAQQAQHQEIEADTFALKIMRRIGVPPIGPAYFFIIAARMEDTPGDFSSLAEYEQYLRGRATHPVSALRILKIAEDIQNNTPAYARLQHDHLVWEKKLQVVASHLQEIARGLDDRNMRIFQKSQTEKLDVAALRRACRR